MSLYLAVQGDNRTVLPAYLTGVSDLTGATAVVAHLTGVYPATGTYSLGVTVTDPANRAVRLTIQSTDSVAPGEYLLEWQVTFSDGTVLTWPTDGYDLLRVRPQLA
jgi:hypothetical protein